MTDYLAFIMPFGQNFDPESRTTGLFISWVSDAPNGFSDDHVEAIINLQPYLSLVAKLANKESIAVNVMTAYLGENTAHQVMNGQIELGDGQDMRAVIWFCDLRNSTPLAERLSKQAFLDMLNDYFAALAGSVLDHDGEVLRFIGDAALAIFPIAPDAFSETGARTAALSAAREALTRADAMNQDRLTRGDEPFDFGIGLHVGEIMYGNIGVPSRLEFSVIGPAANEAARIESMTKTLGEKIVVSSAFAEGPDEQWRDLGSHAIRGSAHEIRLFGLNDS